MGEFITSVLASMTTSAAVSAVLVWLGKTWIGEKMKGAIKHEYEEKLETLRAKLKAESDKEIETMKIRLKAEADVAGERLRANLQIASAEHQIRFASLHVKVAETVEEAYVRLKRLQRAVADYTKPFVAAYDKSLAEKRKLVVEEGMAFPEFYNPKKLYIPPRTAQRIDTFVARLLDLAMQFHVNADEDIAGSKDVDVGMDVWKSMLHEIPPLFSALEKDFQALLGFQMDGRN